MRIGIAGAGVAGAYLACMLSSRHEVEVFDRKEKDKLGHDCAWLFHHSDLYNYCGKCGLNPVRYLEHVGRTFSFFGVTVAIGDLITFNKHHFLIDLLKRAEEVHFGSKISRSDLEDFDLVIDATGPSRALLPPPLNRLKLNWSIPCYQLEVESHDLPKDFYTHPAGLGYLWVFPRGENTARVGCGSLTANPKTEVEEYLANKSYKLLRVCNGTVRIIPPSKSKPFHVAGEPNIVGVGECVGAISPLSGEGNRDALKCADLFLEALEGDLNVYERRVLEKFSRADREFAFLQALRCRQPQALWRLFKLSPPFGLRISKLDALRMLLRREHLQNLQESLSLPVVF